MAAVDVEAVVEVVIEASARLVAHSALAFHLCLGLGMRLTTLCPPVASGVPGVPAPG